MTLMAAREFSKTYTVICRHLAERRLKPAFDLLEKVIVENGLAVFYDKWRELDQTYQFMLKYTVEGIQDPERQKVYRKLIVSAFELADQINETIRFKYSSSIGYEKKRIFKSGFNTSLESLYSDLEEYYSRIEQRDPAGSENATAGENRAEAAKHHQQMGHLFNHVWFCDHLNAEETGFMKKVFANQTIPAVYRSFLLSALTLSLQRYFDEAKFRLLFDALETGEAMVNQRALVGLLITLYQYDNRLSFYPEITGRLEILNADPAFKQDLERIIIQLIRSKETEKLQRRIRDEILPEMIKISPTLKDKINLESLMDEGLSDDKNPEWKEIRQGLVDKMEEFSKLQMEGADVFIGSFAMLKQFPFFNEPSNWMVPFFTENPDIRQSIDVADEINRSFIEMINRAPVLCNSDKYSFCFSIQSLPKTNREAMAQGIKAMMDQLQEIELEEEPIVPDKNAEFVSNHYIQDLYRFYKLHPRKNDFDDIFSWPFDFHNKIVLGHILKEDKKVLRNIAEYYFSKNYFAEAADILGYLLISEKEGELYQKIAFCYQRLGDFEKALESYQKADLYDSNRLWNLKKIALCYRNLKQPQKALEYYQQAENLDPGDLSNLLNVGHCLLELGRFDEALNYYFKVEYLAPGNKKVWRPIAWCSFLTGKKEQAENYFQKLMHEDPNKHDLMNMGHVQWSLGNRKTALGHYKQSISGNGFSEAEFMDVFNEDLPQLLKQNIDPDDVPIMLDQLRYFVEL
ncbi:MAG: tetratricopeptide repeat protein [Prolixibacteraceae bacterium]